MSALIKRGLVKEKPIGVGTVRANALEPVDRVSVGIPQKSQPALIPYSDRRVRTMNLGYFWLSIPTDVHNHLNLLNSGHEPPPEKKFYFSLDRGLDIS